MANQNKGEKGAVGDSGDKKENVSPHTVQIQNANPFGPTAISPQEYQKFLEARQSNGDPMLAEPPIGNSETQTAQGRTDVAATSKTDLRAPSREESRSTVKSGEGPGNFSPLPGKEAPNKSVTPPTNDGGAVSVTQKVAAQGGEQLIPGSNKTSDVRTGTASTDTGITNRPLSAPAEQSQLQNRGVVPTPGERVSPVDKLTSGDKSATGDKVAGGDRAITGDNSGARKIEPSASSVGAAYMPPANSGEAQSGTRKGPAVSSDGTAGNVANTGVKAELQPGAKPVQDGTTAFPAGQQKVEAKLDGGSVIQPGGAQPKVESARLETPKLETPKLESPKLEQPRLDSQNPGQGKLEPAKGSDVFSTQGSTAAANRQEGFKSADPKVDGVRPADQAGSRYGSTMRDPKSAGVANEVFGQKNEPGARGDSQSGGFKPEGNAAGQKADQITRGIESRVNESVKQPGTTDGAAGATRQPVADTSGKSPGITDGAQPGAKQTGSSDTIGNPGSGKQPGAEGVSTGTSPNVRQPLSDGGDKGSSGGGSSVAESTKRIDVGMQQGGKSDGQAGNSGMGGGSSSPVDRAPHAPFRVEDAQPAGSKGEPGFRGDAGVKGDLGGKGEITPGAKGDAALGGKGEASVGGKGSLGADGPRFDSGETRGTQPGARFDTGEVRGPQPSTRFDAGEVKDGRGGLPTGGKSGDIAGGASDANVGIGKGIDASGTKVGSGGGTGSGGSSGGAGGSEGGILGDKRQPSMFPESPVNPGGKPGKPGEVIGSGPGVGDDSVPFVLPGAFGGKDGGRRQSDQIFGDKTKGDPAGGKPESGAKADLTGKTDPTGKADSTGKAELTSKAELTGKSESGAAGKVDSGSMIAKFDALVRGDKGTKADAGISAAMAGQVGTGAAEVGNVLKNFAQSVLSDGKSGQGNDGRVGQGNDGKTAQGSDAKTIVTGDSKDARTAGKAQSGGEISGKETPNVRQDFAGPGQKTRILDQTTGSSDTKIIGDVAGPRAVGPGAIPADAAKKSELAAGSGIADANLLGGEGGDGVGKISTDDINLPEVNLLGETDESEKVEEIEEVEESEEAKREDEMHYELALGLQLYTSIAEAPYGAYHYFTKDGDTVESVSREVVGDARTAPLVFSLNKDHILASTEYGVHPFKVGVMVQLPTPRDLKNFFGSQT